MATDKDTPLPYGKGRTPPGTPTIKEMTAAAIARGDKTFDPGIPCIRGHISRRNAASGQCQECWRLARPTHAMDPVKLKASRDRGDANRDKAHRKAQRIEWYRANKERLDARHKEWQARNIARSRVFSNARTTRWRKRNLAQDAAKSARRRAVKLAAETGDRGSCVAFFKWAGVTQAIPCYWCKKKTTPGFRHIDHIIPLSKGGPDSTGNLCVSCPPCNSRKGALSPEDFAGQSELRFA